MRCSLRSTVTVAHSSKNMNDLKTIYYYYDSKIAPRSGADVVRNTSTRVNY